MLLVVSGEVQAPKAPGPGVALCSFHQLPAIPLAPQRLGDHHRFHKQALRLANHTGQPGMPKQLGLHHLSVSSTLCSPLGLNQYQAQGEAVCGLLEGVDARGFALFPLFVDEFSTGLH